VAFGPALQIVRGLIIAAVLYPFRSVVFGSPRGWLKLAALLVGLCVLSTSGPTPGSAEGFVYTRLSWIQHLRGLPEVILQNIGTAALLVAWYRTRGKALGIVLGVLFALGIAASLAGGFAAKP
jgi:hypothetical protein